MLVLGLVRNSRLKQAVLCTYRTCFLPIWIPLGKCYYTAWGMDTMKKLGKLRYGSDEQTSHTLINDGRACKSFETFCLPKHSD